jgi:hypothetical protein
MPDARPGLRRATPADAGAPALGVLPGLAMVEYRRGL